MSRILTLKNAALACTLLLLPAAAAAQPNLAAGLDNVIRAPQGTWAEYKMSKDGVARTLTMRASLVLRTKKLIVQEFAMATPMGKVLTRIEYTPTGKGAWKVSRGLIKVGQTPPRVVPMPQKAVTIKRGQTPGKLLGVVKLKTKAGTFRCKRYKRDKPKQELWVSDRAHPTGLVKVVLPGGKLELVALGKGAKPTLDPKEAVAPAKGKGKGAPRKHKHKGKHKH
jgi:hypothetical protein